MCHAMHSTISVTAATIFWTFLFVLSDTTAQRIRTNGKRVTRGYANSARDFDDCLNKSPLECAEYNCHYVNPRTMQELTESCYYDKLQRSCLCPREEAAVPCQVHGKDTCEMFECPYAKKTGRRMPNCVWNEHKQRCKSPEPSFFYMLTEDSELYLTDPDDQTLKYIRSIEDGVSIASDIHGVNGLYAVTNGKKFQNLIQFSNVYEDQNNGTVHRRAKLRNITALGEGRLGERILIAGKHSDVYSFSPRRRVGKPLGHGQHIIAGDLATNPKTHKIYGLSDEGVFEINPDTGSHSNIIVSLPRGTQYALAFTCDGRLWASGSNRKIYEILVETRQSRFLMLLGVHTPLDFSSQPGC